MLSADELSQIRTEVKLAVMEGMEAHRINEHAPMDAEIKELDHTMGKLYSKFERGRWTERGIITAVVGLFETAAHFFKAKP